MIMLIDLVVLAMFGRNIPVSEDWWLVAPLFGRNIPVSEDWWLVAPLTDNEPNLAHWLWAPNNEHRIPFPRLIMLGLLKLAGGDWRSGMFFNIILLGLLAAAFILAARKLRNGRSIFADTLFPIALLSLGNWENLYWSWQVTQVATIALTCILLLLIVTINEKMQPVAMIAAGAVLILLPLSGATGLLWLPISLLFFTYYGWHCRQEAPKGSRTRRAAEFLLLAVVVSLLITSIYLVGLRQPEWMPPNPGILPSLYAVMQFLALGIGPIARSAWFPAIAITLLIFVSTAVILAHAGYRFLGTKEEMRVMGLLAFFGNGLFFALATGFGRAGVIGSRPGWMMWPIRYAQFVAPLLFTAYFAWLLYLPRRFAKLTATALALLLLLLIPLNTVIAYGWHFSTSERDEQIMAHIRAGVPTEDIATKFRDYLWSWAAPGQLEENLRWLKDGGFPPFDNAPSVLVSRTMAEKAASSWPAVELRYQFPQAQEVFLLWGIGGWQTIPEQQRPAGTIIENELMKSPMLPESDAFVSRVQVPPGASLQYGFEINGRPLWLTPYYLGWDFGHDELLVEEEDVTLAITPYPWLSFRLLPLLVLATGGIFIAIWVSLALVIPVDDKG
jgi:hypothetical protein